MKLALVFQPGKRMSLEEIEREAAAEIQSRVDSGKPPSEEWAALGDAREPLNVDVSGFGEWESEVAASSSAPAAVREATPMAVPAADKAPARKPATRKPAARKPAVRKPATAKPASLTKAKAKPAARRAATS